MNQRMFDPLKKTIKQIMAGMFTELLRATWAGPIKAKVIKSDPAAHCVDVMPLQNNGEEIPAGDSTVQAIKGVKVNTFSGPGALGVFGVPQVGAVVLVQFLGMDPAFPFVAGVLNEEPATTEDGEISLFRTADHHVRLKADGSIVIKGTGNISVETTGDVSVQAGNITGSCTDATLDVSGTLNLGGSGGAEVARKGDAVEVDGKTGEITGGSSKVKAT